MSEVTTAALSEPAPRTAPAAPSPQPRPARNLTLDVFRGLLIALVVIGHTNSPFNLLIYSFHMPAWFIISGLLHRDRPARELISSRLATLIVPFLAANLILWAFFFLLNRHQLNYAFVVSTSGVYKPVTTAMLMNVFTQGSFSVGMLGASWFFPVLFGVSLLTAAMIALQQRMGLSNAALSLVSLGLLAWGYSMGWTRYYVDLILFCQFFYILGYLVMSERPQPDLPKTLILAVTAAAILAYQALFYNKFFNVIGRTYNSPSLLILYSCCGTYLTYLAARHVFNMIPYLNAALAYAGRRSAYILLFHFCGFKIYSLFLVHVCHYPRSILIFFPSPNRQVYPHWYLIALFGIVFSLGVGVAVDRAYALLMRVILGRSVSMKRLIEEFLFKESLA